MALFHFGAPRSRDSSWFVLLAALAVAVPTVLFLWTIVQAMENETAARRQEQNELFRLKLDQASGAVEARLAKFVALGEGAMLKNFEEAGPVGVFLQAAQNGLADGLVILAPDGEVAYPLLAQPCGGEDLEEVDYLAIELRDRFAQQKGSERERVEQALRALRKFDSQELKLARDLSGAIIYPNLLLAALRGMDSQHARFASLSKQLARIVSDYGHPTLPSPQRLFLARELKDLDPQFLLSSEEFEARTLRALGRPPDLSRVEVLVPASDKGEIWSILSGDRRFLMLFGGKRLQDELQTVAEKAARTEGLRVRVAHPLLDSPEVIKTSDFVFPLGAGLPGWELHGIIVEKDGGAMAAGRRKLYLTSATMALALVALLVWLAARGYRQQARETKMRNDFLSTVSHELRTPLTSIRMLVDTLAAGHYKDAERTKRYLEVIARENSRLSHLVETFLTYTRMERGKLKFDFRKCDPADIVDEAAAAVRDRFAAAGVEFTVEIPDSLPAIEADPETLSTALINLLDNAFKYTGAEKRIDFGVTSHRGSVRFTVRDNGEGISARDRKRVMERFYRADSELARSSGGSGLGLSIVKFIVDGHEGSLKIESERGVGSAFSIEIPTTSD